MKKQLLNLLLTGALAFGMSEASAQRYLTEVFQTFNRTNNITYGSNYTVLPGTPTLAPLLMDVYEPDTLLETLSSRPLVVVLHTGSFLPPVINGQPTGSRGDSSLVAICSQFAKRGYVAASMSYRLGWKPDAIGAAGQDIRTGTLLNAVYRAIQDAKACVRYFKADAANANTWGVDTNRIILLGQGTGGYIVQAYATLDNPAEISLPKFLSSTTDPTYGFVAGQSYVNQAVLGDFDGFGGLPNFNNSNNSPGHTNNVHFIVNLGGAMGDSSWMSPNDPPFIGFHVVGDPFAPYFAGDVVVPTTGDFVVEAFGSGTVLDIANRLGLNNCMNNGPVALNDPISTYANTINNGDEGLYPLITNPAAQAGPWEWYDSLATVFYASFLPPPFNTQGGNAYANSLLTNPDMSKAKALAYIDTIMAYSNPRIYNCLNLSQGLNDNLAVITGLKLMPNPADQQLQIVATSNTEHIRSIEMADITGRVVYTARQINGFSHTVDRAGLPGGVYLVRAKFDKGTVTLKAIFR